MFISEIDRFLVFSAWCHIATLGFTKVNNDAVEIIHWGSCFGAILGSTLSFSIGIICLSNNNNLILTQYSNMIGIFSLISTPILAPLSFYLITAWIQIYILTIILIPKIIYGIYRKLFYGY